MSEEIKIIDGTFKKDDPHKDIGKQKFRCRLCCLFDTYKRRKTDR